MNLLQTILLRAFGVAALALTTSGAFAVALEPPQIVSSVTVPTDKGPVTGAASATMNMFLGIPYAAPPVGALRWRAPQPSTAWPKLRATRFANHCPQLPGPYGLAGSTEDCLYLNVYAPNAGPGRHPVMIYIHGGSNKVGESDALDPTDLVAQNVVVVTINYRLGVLGFLSHPALSAESPDRVSGNYGILDQQAAMRWVQRNIANFGGDPNNLTLFGESAGGLDIHTHLASPLAAGLFHRAIVQSGAYAVNQSSMAANENRGNAFGARYGCPAPTTVDCLRSISVANALAEPASTAISGPVVDGVVLNETINAALASGRFNRVPVMEGSNRDEWRLFVGTTELATGTPLTAEGYPAAITGTLGVTGATRNAIIAEYPLVNYANPSFAFAALVTDTVYACSSRKAIRQMANFVPVYAYEFNDPDAPQTFLPPVSFPYGSAHASELNYLFKLRPSIPDPVPLNANQRLLSQAMVRYWTQFARQGNPNSAATPLWPAYDSATDQRQSLTPPTPYTQSSFAVDHHCAFWAPGT
ncbi:carboxylesterase/lipase family protein [Piscinibacter koreensis]|uniref:Carboxylic ester hydrolase n=1 Tax=Piscinibacter koreensis TaxID=2742824 RepID=A0A7Y6NLH9_9BURK|nr:carboxylesterase family protein [Schlegelella koreensis]NUZ05287.1 carboxylesterase family protein [Schlegelella koreensis]